MAWIRLGTVARAVGLDGRLGVAGTEGAVARMSEVALRRAGAPESVRRVLSAGPQGRTWWVRLEGVTDRTAAEALRGSEVWGRREEMGDAGPGRHFWSDLQGLPVTTVAGEDLGRVEELYVTGGVDVLVVRGPGGRERLVPLAPWVTVDVGQGRVVVDPPPGLLEDDEEERGTERNRT